MSVMAHAKSDQCQKEREVRKVEMSVSGKGQRPRLRNRTQRNKKLNGCVELRWSSGRDLGMLKGFLPSGQSNQRQSHRSNLFMRLTTVEPETIQNTAKLNLGAWEFLHHTGKRACLRPASNTKLRFGCEACRTGLRRNTADALLVRISHRDAQWPMYHRLQFK